MSSSKPIGLLPVIAALAGNIFITAMKWGGFIITASPAMFSEAIHSVADTGNQALLMVGIKRSQRKANKNYYYGFGQERFFWSLISACGIFFVGAGITVYHGITALLRPEPITANIVNYIILAVALVIESVTLVLAIKELKAHTTETKVSRIIRHGDPTTLAVVYEDGVAVLGLLFALAGIGLTALTGSSVWDALSSIIIGCLLALVAILLIIKNREFLLEKAMPRAMEEQVLDLLNAEPAVEKVIDFKSSVLDINTYRVKCEIEFNGTELLKEINNFGELKEEFEKIREDYSLFVRFCTEMSDRAPRLIGTKINEIEKRIQERVPEVRHIDIELN